MELVLPGAANLVVMSDRPADAELHERSLAGLTDEQREWAVHSEALWARARRIATEHEGVDAGDVYHALRSLELSPAERLRRGLSRGRLRAHTR